MNSKCEQMLKDTGNKRTKKQTQMTIHPAGRNCFVSIFFPICLVVFLLTDQRCKQQNFDEIHVFD